MVKIYVGPENVVVAEDQLDIQLTDKVAKLRTLIEKYFFKLI